LGVTSWTPWAFENNINTPGWTVGTFMFLYLFFPTAMRIISGKKKETSLSY
jgi:peptidoglycan/LPS O-acetylase OafA/YrhL